MTRLMVFLSVLAGLILILVLYTFKSVPVSNEKFDLKKTEEAYLAQKELIAKVTEPKEAKEGEEAVEIEYAPVVDLSTPQLQAGNKVYGQCIACHGKGGEGKDSQKAPHIGGQYDWYIEKQLTDMKSGARINPAMDPILKGLTPDDIKNVAAYVALLPWNKEAWMAAQKAAAAKK